MTTTPDSFSRDANGVPIVTMGLQEQKSITYVAGTTGAVGATTLFTVTGTIAVNIFGFCTTDLTGSGTLEIGTASSTAALCNQQSATAIDNHEVWHDAVLAIGGSIAGHWHAINENIIQTIATNTVTAGVLVFYCNWVPLSEGSSLVAA
jgi:hypothetical protein